MIDRDWLERMDGLRSEDPTAALESLLEQAPMIPKDLSAFFLGVCGSTYRILAGRSNNVESLLDEAEAHLRYGLWIAQHARDRSPIADLLIRISYVDAERGRYQEALSHSEAALVVAERAGDRVGRGKALVEQGRYLYYLNDLEEATRAYVVALDALPESQQANRFAAYQGLGFCYLGQGQLEEARRFADLAAPMAPNSWQQGKLLWLQASIYLQLRDLNSAEQYLLSVLETFRQLHYGEAAHAACELVKVQLLRGRLDAAWQTASAVRELIIPLGDNHMVAAALMDLVRGGQAALTLGRVEKAVSRIETARESRRWPSLAASH